MATSKQDTSALKFHTVRFSVHNVEVTAWTDQPETAGLYVRLCHGKKAETTEAGRAPGGARVVIAASEKEAVVPKGHGWSRLGLGRDSKDVLWYNAGTGRGICRTPPQEDVRGARYAVMQSLALYMRLRTREAGLFYMHAAGVIWKNMAVLACGDSGSGKSTLMRELVKGGCRYLADDSVAVRERGGKIQALRAREAVYLKDLPAAEVDRFRKLGFLEGPMEGYYYAPGGRNTARHVGTVVFSRMGKKTGIRRLTREETAGRLPGANETPLLGNDLAEALGVYAALAEQAAGIEITQRRGEAFSAQRLMELL